MKFVLAPDSFKGSMTAMQVANSMEKGLKTVFPSAEIVKVPVADGGEGTVQSLVDATDGKMITATVTGPLSVPVEGSFGILGDGITAVIEMAEASGIGYINEQTRNPLIATTRGTGELICKALDYGVRKIILGIGGSATNDGGMGMAVALGVKFLDKQGQPITEGGGELDKIETIDISGIDPRVAETQFIVACDVTNPLTGKDGASAVFGPQKGATPEMVAVLDKNLRFYAEKIHATLGIDIDPIPGSGAAGGLGGGLIAFTGATLHKGIDIVIDYTRLKEKLAGADYVFTGEGGIDFQTKFGKTPYGVAQAAKDAAPQAPVIALAGLVGNDIASLYDVNFTAVFGILRRVCPLEDALREGPESVASTTENIARLIKANLC